MVKCFFSFLLMTLLVTSAGFGGVNPVKKRIMDEPTAGPAPLVQTKGVPGVENGTLSWSFVDSMANCYGMLTNTVDPLAYDPVSNSLAVIHRGHVGYAAGSGELWYNTSTDAVSWSQISPLNAGAPISSRYPSCWISSGSGAGNELFVFSAPQLTPAAFGFVIYGVDVLNAAAPYAVEDQGEDATFWSNTRITAADDSPYIWWATAHATPNTHNSMVHLWRTMDYGVVDQFDVWDLSLFTASGLETGLAYRNGTLYLGGYATFPGDLGEVWNLFYSSSADMGATWTAPNGPNVGTGDWRSLPAIAASPYDDWFVSPTFADQGWDLQVDDMGYVHFFGVLEDLDDPNADLAVVEIFETAAGWDARFVAENLVASTRVDYDGFYQMGYHVGSAASADGSKLAAVWLSAAAAGDTLPDVWISHKNVADASWSTPINLTETVDYAELLLQVAPILRDDGSDLYTVFLSRAYQTNTTAYPPDDLGATAIYTASYQLDFSGGASVEPTPGVPSVYKLEQNYPNPFNPTTNIRYSIPNSSFVSLKVFDMLGQEVATLYNGNQDAGSYVADFDAANLANGTYYYTLTAGSFSETKKMLVLK